MPVLPVAPPLNAPANAPVAVAPAAPVTAGGSPATLPSMQPPLNSALAWKLKSNDAVTSLMTVNYGAKPLWDRFDGLGAAALNRFTSDGGDFSQTVSQANADTGNQFQIALKIRMVDGIDVAVTLDSLQNSLSLQIHSSGKLSSVDRAALARLAAGFQDAIDGMKMSQPDFSGLLKYDAALMSSVDLQATLQNAGMPPQTQAFHADGGTRSFSADGSGAAVKVSVDLRHLGGVGNARQRQDGVEAYLKQFDEAGARGHANRGALDTFKAAFKQLAGSPIPGDAPGVHPAIARPISLTDSDHALLSGLPDFSASIVDTPVASNPMRPGELDTFLYTVSQETAIGGRSQLNRSFAQKRHAHLDASYHEPLSAGTPLALDNTRESQNYYFKKVSEDRVSDTQVSYHNGMIAGATTHEHISRSTQVLQYVMGVLTDADSTPEETDTWRDLLKQPHIG